MLCQRIGSICTVVSTGNRTENKCDCGSMVDNQRSAGTTNQSTTNKKRNGYGFTHSGPSFRRRLKHGLSKITVASIYQGQEQLP